MESCGQLPKKLPARHFQLPQKTGKLTQVEPAVLHWEVNILGTLSHRGLKTTGTDCEGEMATQETKYDRSVYGNCQVLLKISTFFCRPFSESCVFFLSLHLYFTCINFTSLIFLLVDSVIGRRVRLAVFPLTCRRFSWPAGYVWGGFPWCHPTKSCSDQLQYDAKLNVGLQFAIFKRFVFFKYCRWHFFINVILKDLQFRIFSAAKFLFCLSLFRTSIFVQWTI